MRFYTFHLRHRAHPGMVYSFLPAIANALDLDQDGRAWLTWLNGNTQNAVTSLLLLEAAPSHHEWKDAVAFWNENFKKLEWDTDRRHQKSKFGVATEEWAQLWGQAPAGGWLAASQKGWKGAWQYSFSQPFMGRLSAWSMMEYARILLGHDVPDMGEFLLEDQAGSRSHRNGLATLMGYDAVYWDPTIADMIGIVPKLNEYAEYLLKVSHIRNPGHPEVSRLTMESALCTWKGMWKPNRRYPGVYADMMYLRIKKAEARFNRRFDLLWETRRKDLPGYLRLEDRPFDPGLAPAKQNWFRETGEIVNLSYEWPDMTDGFEHAMGTGQFGKRKDPSWT